MATVPRRGNFTKRKRRFSYIEKYEPSSRPQAYGDESEGYSSAEEVDIDEGVDHFKVLKAARDEEENRALAHKAAKKAMEDEAKSRTVKARVIDRGVALARRVANAVSPDKKVTIKLKRRGEDTSGGLRVKNRTKKQVKTKSKHKQNKGTKRQPKRRN